MTSGELARSAWVAGCVVVATAGHRLVTQVRKLPREILLRCRNCDREWIVVTTDDGRVRREEDGKATWRACPGGCNRGKRRR